MCLYLGLLWSISSREMWENRTKITPNRDTFHTVRYVDILFHLTKAIPIRLQQVTSYYQTLQTWIGHNVTRYYNYHKHYQMRYFTFSLSLAWYGSFYNRLPRVIVRFI